MEASTRKLIHNFYQIFKINMDHQGLLRLVKVYEFGHIFEPVLFFIAHTLLIIFHQVPLILFRFHNVF